MLVHVYTSTASTLYQVTAELTPMSKSRVAVQFKTFKLLGLVPVQAPPSARGTLDTTYLDDDLRISRGDKGACLLFRHSVVVAQHMLNTGNLFVLTKT